MLERGTLVEKARNNPFLKQKPQSDSGITYAGKEISEWITENLSPSELGEKYIVLLQTHHHHTHFQIPQNKSDPILEERKASSDLEKEFNERADRWEEQTGFQSSPTKRFMHEDYQTIMTMGDDVIPLILKRLQTKPN